MEENKKIVNLRPDPIVERGSSRISNSQYDRGLTEGETIGDVRADSQGWWDATSNFVTNFVGSTAINVGGLATLAYGGIKSKAGFGKFSDLFDNEVSKGLSNLQTALDEATPFYNTQQEDNSGLSWDYLKSAGFWGNVIGKGGSFIAGAYVGGGLTGKALSTLGKGARALGVLATDESKVAQFANAIKNNSQVSWLKNNTGVSSIKNFTKYQAQVLSGNMYEASVEASGVREEIIKNKEQEYRESLRSSLGDSANTAPIPEVLKREWEELADKYGNIAFGMNMALLKIDGTGFNKMLYGYRNTKKAVDIAKNGLKYGELSLKKKILNKVGKTVGGGLFEGLQEGGQFVVEKGTVEVAKQKNDYIYATIKGLEETFDTKDGQTSMLAGLLLGGFGEVVSSAFDEKNLDKKAISILNNYTATDSFRAKVKYLNEVLNSNSAEKKENSLDFADKFTYKNQEASDDFNYWQSRVSFDRVSDGIEDLQAFKNTPFETLNEQFKTQFKNETDKNEHFQERINKAEKVEKIHNQIEEVFGNRDNKESLKKYAFLLYDVQERIKNLQPKLQDDVTGKVAEDLKKLTLREEELKNTYTNLLQNKDSINIETTKTEESKDSTEVKENKTTVKTETKKVGDTIELEVNKPSLIVGETEGTFIIKDENGVEKEISKEIISDVEVEDSELELEEDPVETDDSLPNTLGDSKGEHLLMTSLGLRDWEKNVKWDNGLHASNPEITRQLAENQEVKKYLIDNNLSPKDIEITTEKNPTKNGSQVFAKIGDKKFDLGYFVNPTALANNSQRSIKEFVTEQIAKLSQIKGAEVYASKLQKILSTLIELTGDNGPINISKHIKLYTKIAKGEVSVSDILSNNRWKTNGQLLTFSYSNGSYDPDSSVLSQEGFNEENKALIKLLNVDPKKHTSPYIIFVKRPDTDELPIEKQYVALDIKGSKISKEMIEAFKQEASTTNDLGILVDKINKNVFLTSFSKITLQTGKFKGQQVPAHLKFFWEKTSNSIRIIAEPKFTNGKVYSINGEEVSFNTKEKYAFSNLNWEEALLKYGTEKFDKEDSIENKASKLKVNTTADIWGESFFSFNSLEYNTPNIMPDVIKSNEALNQTEPEKEEEPQDLNWLDSIPDAKDSQEFPDVDPEMSAKESQVKYPIVKVVEDKIRAELAKIVDFDVIFYNSENNWGEFVDNVIKLNREFPEGTHWHEAFHGVFSLLSKQEQNRVLRIAYNKFGVSSKEVLELDNIYRSRGYTLTQEKLISIVLEEKVADHFREFMLGQPTGFFANFFAKLKKLVDYLFSKTQDDEFNSFFNRIKSGEFKGKKSNGESIARYSVIPFSSSFETNILTRRLLAMLNNRKAQDSQYTEEKDLSIREFIANRLKALQEEESKIITAEVNNYKNNPEQLKNFLDKISKKYEKEGTLVYPKYLSASNWEMITKYVVTKGQLRFSEEKEEEDYEELFEQAEYEKNISVKRASKNVREILSSLYYIDNKGRVIPLDDKGVYNNLLLNLSDTDPKDYENVLLKLSQGTSDRAKQIEQVYKTYKDSKVFKNQVNTAFDVSFVKAIKSYDGKKGKKIAIENYKDHEKKQIEVWNKQAINKTYTESSNPLMGLGLVYEDDLLNDEEAKPLISQLEDKLTKKVGSQSTLLLKDAVVKDLLNKLANLNIKYRFDLGELNFRNAENKLMYSMVNNSFLIRKLKELKNKSKDFDFGLFIGAEFGKGYNAQSYASLNPKEKFFSDFSMFFNKNNNDVQEPWYFIQQLEAKNTNFTFKGIVESSDFTNVQSRLNILKKKKDRVIKENITLLKEAIENDVIAATLIEGYHIFKVKEGESFTEAAQRTLLAYEEFAREGSKTKRNSLPRGFQYFNIPFANDKTYNEEYFTEKDLDKFLKIEHQNILNTAKSLGISINDVINTYAQKDLATLKSTQIIDKFNISQFLNSALVLNEILDDQAIFKNFVDLTKRGGGLLASGPSHGTGNFSFGIIKDYLFKENGEFLTEGERRSGVKEDVNSTDAQGVESINERINRYIRLGLVADETSLKNEKNDELFNAWQLLEAYRMDDRVTIKRLEKSNELALLKVDKTVGYNQDYYIKTSVSVLTRFSTSYVVDPNTPGAFKDVNNNKYYLPIAGKEFGFRLLNQMQEQDLQSIFAESAVKKSLNGVYYEQSDVPIAHNFTYADYRLQQENPSGKVKIKDGSQLIQLIDAYIENSVSPTLDGLISDIKNYNFEWYSNVGQTPITINDEVYIHFLEYVKSNIEGTAGNERLQKFFSTTKDGKLRFSPDMPMMRTKFEQMFLSYYNNNVAAHKTPGSKYTLLSSEVYKPKYLLKTINGVEVKDYLTDYEFNNLTASQKQRVLTDDKLAWVGGDITHAQIVLSEEYLSQIGVSIEEWVRLKKEWLTNPESKDGQLFDKISTVLCYRIPTQAQHSMLPARIIDFLPKSYGSTVITPREITKISGADYDVDSLFVHRYATYKNNKSITLYKDDEKSKTKSLLKNDIYSELLSLINTPEIKTLRKEISTLKDNIRENNKKLSKYTNTEKVDLMDDKSKEAFYSTKELLENQTEEYSDYVEELISKIEELQEPLLNDLFSNPKIKELIEGSFVPESNFNKLLDERLRILTENIDLINQPAKDHFKDLFTDKLSKVLPKELNNFDVYSSYSNRFNEWLKVTAGKAAIGGAANINKVAAFLTKNSIELSPTALRLLSNYNFKFTSTTSEENDFNLVEKDGQLFIEGKRLVEKDGKKVKPFKFDTLSNNVSITVDNAKDQTLKLFGLHSGNISEASVLAALGFGRERLGVFLNTPIAKRISNFLAIPANEVNKSREFKKNKDKLKDFVNGSELEGIPPQIQGNLVVVTDEDLIESVNKFAYIESILDKDINELSEDDIRLINIQYSLADMYKGVAIITDDFYHVNKLLNFNKTVGKDFQDALKILESHDSFYKKEFSLVKDNLVDNQFINSVSNIVNNIANVGSNYMHSLNPLFHETISELFDSLKDATSRSKQDISAAFIDWATMQAYNKNNPTINALNEEDLLGTSLVNAYKQVESFLATTKIGSLFSIDKPTARYPFPKVSIDTFGALNQEDQQELINDFDNVFNFMVGVPLELQEPLKEFYKLLKKHIVIHDNFKFVKGSIVSLLDPDLFNRINNEYNNIKDIQGDTLQDKIKLLNYLGDANFLEIESRNQMGEYAFENGNYKYEGDVKKVFKSQLAEFSKWYFSDKRRAFKLGVSPNLSSIAYLKTYQDGELIETLPLKGIMKDGVITIPYIKSSNQSIKYPISFKAFKETGNVFVLQEVTKDAIIYKVSPKLQIAIKYGDKQSMQDVSVRPLQFKFDDFYKILQDYVKENPIGNNKESNIDVPPIMNPHEEDYPNYPENESNLGDLPNIDPYDIPNLPNNIDDLIDNNVNGFLNKEINKIGINIFSKSIDWLGKALTNPTYNKYQIEDSTGKLFDLESIYKANASKKTAPQLNPKDALKYDMNLMYSLQVQKFRKYPELIEEINKRGGEEFIKNSSHIIGVKNSRWEGQGLESNFIKVLLKSYQTVNKEINPPKLSPKEVSLPDDLNNQMITASDKIIFGHPTIGKSYLKKNGANDFITLDDDYADEVNTFIDKNRGSETRQEYKGRKPKEYNEFMLNLFDRLKVQAKKEGKRLFVSNTNILKERMSEFDKVITIPKDEFKKRFDARGATYGFEDWKSDIDATVDKVDKSKVISTTGYLSDLLKQSDDLVEAQTIDPTITPEVWNSMNEEEKENWFKCNRK